MGKTQTKISEQDAANLAIDAAGGTAAVAKYFETSLPAISRWRRNGVPGGRVMRLYRLSGGVVTPHQLNPSAFPNPEDGVSGPAISARQTKRQFAQQARET